MAMSKVFCTEEYRAVHLDFGNQRILKAGRPHLGSGLHFLIFCWGGSAGPAGLMPAASGERGGALGGTSVKFGRPK